MKFFEQIAVSLLIAISINICASAQAKLSYHVDIVDADHHLAKISLQATLPNNIDSLLLQMPAWRTGRYTISNFSNGVRDFSAKSENGDAIAWEKTDKNSWLLQTNGEQQIVVEYLLYANQLGDRTRHIDDTHAFFDATATFLYSPEFRDEAIDISLNVPENWRSVSGLLSGANPHSFVAENYDQLADSPIESGIHELATFQHGDQTYDIVIWGEGNHDIDRIAKDINKLVRVRNTMWSDEPYERYVFMIHATDNASGATEHVNSSITQERRYDFAPRKNYIDFLSTISHEWIHTWNVKAYRPKLFTRYDYQQENYTDLLWFVEGGTSYYQNILLLRAGIITVDEFLGLLSSRVENYQKRPGATNQSVTEASFDNWISEGGAFGHNFENSIYAGGFMASWLLDIEIIKNSRQKKSLANAHDQLFKDFSNGYTSSDLKEIVTELGGNGIAELWSSNIEAAGNVDVESLLERVGLEIDKGESDVLEFGWRHSDDQGQVKLTRVTENLPAWEAGLTAGDVLFSIDDQRVTDKNLDQVLRAYKPGDQITIGYFRRNKVHSTQLTIASEGGDKWKIKKVKDPSRAQKQFFKTWTGVELDSELTVEDIEAEVIDKL